ncbi:MAG TPA: DUF4350 domain-containing protein [Candidatus Thermoplasmatota archaeon]|nr:DUF4350 domain-containing protein [Candidatus Thermoplasmatota archaeon]
MVNLRWVPWAAVVLLVAAVILGGTLSAVAREPDSAFVADGGGARSLVEEARSMDLVAQRLASGPSGLRADGRLVPERTLLVVLSPGRAYSEAEAREVAGFVARGGQLLVADDFGQANSLTVRLGVTFERVRLVEPRGESATVALDGRSYDFALDGPTGLKIAPDTPSRVLAWSSPTSFLDRDGNGIIDATDPPGPFPLVAELDAPAGTGRIFAVADANLLLPAGADTGGNSGLRQGLLAYALPDGGVVLVDEGHTLGDPGLQAMALAVSAAAQSPWRFVLLGLAAALGLGLLAPYLQDRWRPHRFRPHRFSRRAEAGPAALAGPASHGHDGDSDVPRAHWTPRGVAAFLAAGALALLALVFGSEEAGYASAALVAAIAMAAIPRLPRVQAQRTLSTDRLDEGSEVQVSLDIQRGLGRATDLEFRDHLPDEFEVQGGMNWFRTRLAPGAPLAIQYSVVPALRGPYAVGPLHVRREDVLGLHIQEAHLAAATPLRVNPRKESVRKLPFRTRVPTITLGPHLVNRAGDGSEFHALRTYQTGDSYRNVNWKASARSKDLMVNQRVHESMTHLTIFLDARAVSAYGPASSTPLANGCRAVLSMAIGSLRVRDRLRIVAYGDGVHEVPPMPGSRQQHALTELLAGLPAAGTTTFGVAVQQLLPTLRGGTPVMLASGLEGDPTLVEGMRMLRSRGLLPFVIASPIGVEPVDPEDGEAEPGADDLLAQRRRTMAELQALGIPVFDAVPNVPLDYMFRTGGGL